ncbi:hypothetical protein GCM10009577_05090 [Streptomyces javensis]
MTTRNPCCGAKVASPLHHTSWQVTDVDEVGRGATRMLTEHPERHVWGLGRHHIGSDFFWYLKDPAGNFSEYYADMDCIGLHRRRPAVDATLLRGHAGAPCLGASASAVVPRPRGPARADDRRPHGQRLSLPDTVKPGEAHGPPHRHRAAGFP